MKYLENLMQGESGGTYMQRLRSWAYPPPLVTSGPSTSSSAVLYSRCIGRWQRPTAITNKQTNKQTLYGFCYQPAKKGIHQKQVDSLRSVSFLYWYKTVLRKDEQPVATWQQTLSSCQHVSPSEIRPLHDRRTAASRRRLYLGPANES